MLLTSLGQTFFAWRFILNGNIDYGSTISYQDPFVFTVSLLCLQLFKMDLTHAISIVNWIFGFFISKHFSLFFMDFKLLIFRNDIP